MPKRPKLYEPMPLTRGSGRHKDPESSLDFTVFAVRGSWNLSGKHTYTYTSTHSCCSVHRGTASFPRRPWGPAEADHCLWEPPRDSPVPPQGGNQPAPGHRSGLARQPPSLPGGGPAADNPAWGPPRSGRTPGTSHAATSRDQAPSRVPVATPSRSAHTYTHTHSQTHRHTDTQTHRHTDTQTHRHTHKHTHTHRHTDTQKHTHNSSSSSSSSSSWPSDDHVANHFATVRTGLTGTGPTARAGLNKPVHDSHAAATTSPPPLQAGNTSHRHNPIAAVGTANSQQPP